MTGAVEAKLVCCVWSANVFYIQSHFARKMAVKRGKDLGDIAIKIINMYI
jgi:hypothetical protein